MTGLIVVLVVLVCGLGGYMVWKGSPDAYSAEPAPTEAELLQARLDLHRIDRGTDLALASYEARREAEATKEAIAEALRDRQL